MATERPQGEEERNIDIDIIGHGSIGEKAQQLVLKTAGLRQLGFHTPQRVVLADGFFDSFFQRNSLGSTLTDVSQENDTYQRIRNGSLTPEQFQILSGVAHSYSDGPLVVRSSAEGDARGTGTYSSVFTENQPGKVRKAVQEVLASYFSEDAIAFRRDAQTGEGMGIIIEPILGQYMETYGDTFFTPVLSGFGYTSTSRGEGYVTAVPGLGGAVESRLGERLTRRALEEVDGSLYEYVYKESQSMYGSQPMRRSALLRTDKSFGNFGEYSGLAYSPPTPYWKGGVLNQSIAFPKDINEALYRMNLLPFFAQIEHMEEIFKKPQYFEWIMTIDQGQPAYWIVQIADVDKKLDLIDFGSFGKPLFTAHTITGSGIKDCVNIVNCWNPQDIEPLHRFNDKNENYVLLYSSRLSTRGQHRFENLSYSDFSNASVFLEIQDATHAGDPIAHLGGQLDMTGKLFGVLDYRDEVAPDWKTFRAGEKEIDGIRVYQGLVKAVASERQNQMVICLEKP